MSKFWKSLSGMNLKLIASAVLSLCLFGIVALISNRLIYGLEDQHMASRWSEDGDVAQISCYFSESSKLTEDSIIDMTYAIDAGILNAGILQDAENEGARLWLSSYSAAGNVSLKREDKYANVAAYGVGGDFFRFHPLDLVAGGYFYGDDLMQDYCILDTNTAWKLFGSNDIVGMTVDVGNVPHVVVGVYEREESKMLEAAGLNETVIYVSYNSLNAYGSHSGIKHFEVVMPNPIKNFAYDLVKENVGVTEQNVEIVENSSRFSLLSRLKLLSLFGTRSMTGKAIIYPYWENMARGYEDILLVLTFFMVLFVLYPTILVTIWLVRYFRRKTWTFKSVLISFVKSLARLFRFLGKKIKENRKKNQKNKEFDL